jgi:hypothetical protein
MNPFLPEQKRPYLMYVAIGIGCYFLGSCAHPNDGFIVSKGAITYDKTQRPIKVIDDRIIVGDLATRVDDLLLESPGALETALTECLAKRGKTLPK